MADRPERVADFVRDAGGQPAERCQLQLLRLGGELRSVFEHDQCAGVVGRADRREAGAQVAPPRGCTKIRAALRRVTQPLAELLGQRRRGLGQREVTHCYRHPEQHPAGLVHHLDGLLRVDDENPGAHLLDHEVVELRQVGKVGATLVGELFALGGAAAEAVCEQGEGEERGPEQTGLGIGGVAEGPGDMRIDALGQHRERRQRGEQQRGMSDQRQAAERDGYCDQHAQTRLHATAGVHHHRDQHDVEKHRQLTQFLTVTDTAQVHDQGDDRKPEVEVDGYLEGAGQEGAERAAADAEVDEQQGHAKRHPVQQVKAQVATFAGKTRRIACAGVVVLLCARVQPLSAVNLPPETNPRWCLIVSSDLSFCACRCSAPECSQSTLHGISR